MVNLAINQPGAPIESRLVTLESAGYISQSAADVRYLRLIGGTLTGHLLFSADNTYDIGASGATRPRRIYVAGAVNAPLIESPMMKAGADLFLHVTSDNKIGFLTNGIERWVISTTGHLIPATNNFYDIGLPAASKPRNLYLSGSVAVFTKAGVPADSDFTGPIDGMLAINTSAHTQYYRSGGTWRVVAGTAGAPGSKWYTGSGAPAGGTGIVGDFYLNTANGDVHEKTGASAWTLRDNLTGPQGATGNTGTAGSNGAPGSKWFSGNSAPATGLGIVGDWYLRDANGDIYEKTGTSVWTVRDNLTGPQGIQGTQGIQGVKGDTGSQGIQGVQGPPGNTGAQGEIGPQGPTGIQGPKGDTGDTGPPGNQGIQGPIGNTGAQGPKGDTGATGSQGPIGNTGVQGPIGPEGPKGDTGNGVIAGGTVGQVLAKSSDIDYATVWITQTGEGGGDPALEARVAALEEEVIEIRSDMAIVVEDLNNQIVDLTNRTVALETTVASNTGSITALTAAVLVLSKRIDALEATGGGFSGPYIGSNVHLRGPLGACVPAIIVRDPSQSDTEKILSVIHLRHDRETRYADWKAIYDIPQENGVVAEPMTSWHVPEQEMVKP